MALKLFQREIDELLSVITNSSKFRRMVDKRTHICTFNVNQLAGQLKAQTKRTQSYDDFRKGKGEYAGQGKQRSDSTKFKGQKRELAFKSPTGKQRGEEALEKDLIKYCKAVLNAYKKVPYLKLGETIKKGQYTYQTLTSNTEEIIFVIRGVGSTGGQPFDQFKDLNATLQTKVIKGNQDYKKLFGLDKSESDDQAIRRKITDPKEGTQQIGHADGSGIIDKKALSTYALMTSDDDLGGGYTPSILIDEIKGEDGETNFAKKLKDTFGISITGEHAQKFRIKDGQFQDDFEVSVSVESEEANQAKSGRKSLQGALESGRTEQGLADELFDLIADLQKQIEKEYSDPNTNAERKRSTSPIEVVGYMVFGGSNLQKLLKNKKVTKKLSTPFAGKAPKQGAPKKVTRSASTTKAITSASTGLISNKIQRKVGPTKKRKQQRIETGTSTQDALVARAFINSRLSQQVAKNMGRPQLENRSGRFAESVNIVSGTSTGTQSHFDYTYNPLYRVFEGGRDYTPNYDPRDLIEKSIRQLAAARLETKFTLRRV